MIHKLLFFIPLLILVGCNQPEKPVLYLAGDSTMANKPLGNNPEKGWGQMLPAFFDTTKITIENHARNGRSTRSFRYEGLWDAIMNKLKTGDYVVIQFGHNDDVITKTGRYSTPEEYRYNLSRFINDTREKGASPILCPPIVRRNFNEEGNLEPTHGEYPDIVRDLAAALNVPLVDMHLKSRTLVCELGVEKSKAIYLHIPPGVYTSLPDGKTDNTHFSEKGATTMASMFIERLKEIDHPLTSYLKTNE
ncbi:MAG: rhamnogalacturonan acetylesterase [Prolixibacteraceae bacterium]|nr:rhamnogalacturonan acetylesterase [Prolixibacteraceae bacterium]